MKSLETFSFSGGANLFRQYPNQMPFYPEYYLSCFSVPSDAPMYGVWLVYGATCVNAWFWSTVFHTRDIAFTEMMDYFCAFSIVLFSLLAFLLRSVVGTLNNSSLLKFLISGAAGILKYRADDI
jgi:hypothetical protein